MGAGADRFPGLARRARAKYRQLIEPLRATARRAGYALGVHGSLARDIDIIAAPWTSEAVSAEQLAGRLLRTVKRVLGPAPKRVRDAHPRDDWFDRRRRPTEKAWRFFVRGPDKDKSRRKPHGRRCWSIHLGGGPYIDLSVMPRRTR